MLHLDVAQGQPLTDRQANASIERPTANRNNSAILIIFLLDIDLTDAVTDTYKKRPPGQLKAVQKVSSSTVIPDSRHHRPMVANHYVDITTQALR